MLVSSDIAIPTGDADISRNEVTVDIAKASNLLASAAITITMYAGNSGQSTQRI